MSKNVKKVELINKRSKAFSQLEQILKEKMGKNYNERDLYELLVSFRTPNDLYGLTGVAQNLVPILENLKPKMQADKLSKLNKWLCICEEIRSCEKVILKDIPSSLVEDGKNQLHRECTNNAIYSCLWQRAANTKLQDKYAVLQSYIVWAFIRLELNKFDRSIKYEWCKNVRALSEPEYSKILQYLPETLLGLDDYLNKLKEIHSKFSVQPDLREYIDRLIDMVERTESGKVDKKPKATGPRKKRKTTNRSGTKTAKKTRGEMPKPEHVGCYLFDDDETIADVDVETDQGISKKNKSHNNKSGLATTEYAGTHDKMSITPSEPSTGCYTLEEYALLRKAVIPMVAIRNQYLLTRWDLLSKHEFTIVYSILFDTKPNKLIFDHSETRLALALILFTGRPWKQLMNIFLVNKINSLDKLGTSLFYSPESRLLSLPVCSDLYNPELEDKAKACVRSHQQFIQITLPEPMKRLLDEHIAQTHNGKVSDNKKLFKKALDKRYLKRALRNINDHNNTRFTLGKIQSFMGEMIARETDSGRVEAAIFTDNIGPDVKSPLHYTWVPVKKFILIYDKVIQKLLSGINVINVSDKNTLGVDNKKDQFNEIGVGSAITPTKKAVRNLVTALKSSIPDERNTGLSKRVVTFHNQYALYTACMLAYSTGSRATRYPFWLPSDIDESTGLAIISDKDSRDYYNSRLVVLPKVCLEQVKFYKAHLHRLLNRLPAIVPDLFDQLSYQMILNSAFRARDKELKRQAETIPFIFFLRDPDKARKRKWDNSDAEQLTKRISAQLPLPLNVNRHYLRTRLRESGCPETVVNAFMGHWSTGQEPFGRFSTLSPQTYQQILRPHLSKIINSDGWTSIEGGFTHD